MNITVLTAFLSPFLPFLLKLGEKATEGAAEKFGEDAWNKAKAIWEKLRPKVEAKEAAKEAATDVANDPEDEDSQAALRRQLKKLLEQDKELENAIGQIMQEKAANGTPGAQVIQNVTGIKNQTLGQMYGGMNIGNIEGNLKK